MGETALPVHHLVIAMSACAKQHHSSSSKEGAFLSADIIGNAVLSQRSGSYTYL